MKKVIVPMALALAVTASGAAFANTYDTSLNAKPNASVTSTQQMAAASDRSGMKSQNGTKIVWKKHHYTLRSENGLFGPYGPE